MSDHSKDHGPTARPAVWPMHGHTSLADALKYSTPVKFSQPAGDRVLDWSVIEVDTHNVPGARADTCLIFIRPDCMRRVWSYPADWRTLDEEALATLSWQR